MTTPLETTITAVTVYPDRARVTRAGQLHVEPGQYQLEISELPLTLSPESVRASGRGAARARLGGVDVRRAFYTETPSASAAELERRIKELEDQEKALTDEEGVLKSSLGFLNGLAQQSESYGRGLAYGKFGIEESAELLAFFTERATAALDRLRAIAVEKRELADQKTKLQRELNQIHSTRPRERYAATIEIQVSTAGDLNIELTYVVSNAGWMPLYDLRLTEGEKSDQSNEATVEIGYLAQITQRSGEDWPGVQMTLSTARPALSAVLPELNPWYVQVYYPPPPAPMAAPSPKMALRGKLDREKEGTLAAMTDDAFAEAEPVEPPLQIQAAQAEVSREGAAVTFTVARPVDAPSDGSPHKTTVATLPLTPELDYLTAPKLVPAAYRRATITNDTEFVLLPGPVNIFYGHEFVGATQLKHVAPNETFKVFLGADDRIKVERKLVTREVDKRLLGDKRRLRYAYQIQINNLRDRPEQIIVQDQLPVSSHEDIKVRPEEFLLEPNKQTDLGILEWQLALDPGQETKLVFGFTVEHPRNLTITGLPEVEQ
jgi:uncharacterized protein (TIGR02231 family)